MRDEKRARRLFAAVIVGVILYVILDAIAQSLPPHYSAVSQAESDLAVGPYGYIMTINFLNRGVLSLLFIYALSMEYHRADILSKTSRYPKGSALLGVWGVGAILLAIFPTDVPATPVSWHGAIHLVVAVIAFLGGAFGTLRLSGQFSDIPKVQGIQGAANAISLISVIAVLLDLALPFVFPHLNSRIGGLTERFFLATVLLWMAIVSAYAMKDKDSGFG